VFDDESEVDVVFAEVELLSAEEEDDAPPFIPAPPEPGVFASAGLARNSNATATATAPLTRTRGTTTECDTQNPFSFVRLRG
jgi:hypothetical protein